MSLDVTVRGTTIPADELSWRFSRSPGPGGQSVNTADTRVELSYDLATSTALPELLKRRALDRLGGRLTNGVLTVTASEYRSQLRNREAASRPDGRVADRGDRAAAPAQARDEAEPGVGRTPASRQAAPREDQKAAAFFRFRRLITVGRGRSRLQWRCVTVGLRGSETKLRDTMAYSAQIGVFHI